MDYEGDLINVNSLWGLLRNYSQIKIILNIRDRIERIGHSSGE